LDNTDGKLFVGLNIPIRNKTSGRIYSLFTIGSKTNIKEKVSQVFTKEKLKNDISVEGKLTFPLFFSVRYDDTAYQRSNAKILADPGHKSKMDLERTKIFHDKKSKAIKELKELCESLTGIGSDSALIANKKLSQIKKDFEESFYESEAESFDKERSSFSNSYKGLWLSVSGSIPISETAYTIAEEYKTAPHDVYYYPASASARLSFIHDYYKCIKYFINISYIAGKSNTILDNAVDQSSLEKIMQIDSVSSVTNSTKVYYSPFRQNFSDNLKGQAIFFPWPLKNKYIGFDVFGNIELTTGDATWGAGIPLSFKGKDDKSPVNFEIIVNKINQPKNLSIAISLSLPFSSVIY
jgi:hypothetical protein